jgi:hypothetical protein
MKEKTYKTLGHALDSVNEPSVAYRSVPVEEVCPNSWNPNVPFHGTQEEWWDHFHRIEEGDFFTIEEADKEFELWKRAFLASRT